MALISSIAGYGKSGDIQIREQVIGLTETMQALEAFGDAAAHELIGALYREAERILAESREEVPVDTGALRNSADPRLRPDALRRLPNGVEAGYGGTAIPYALRQHEDLSFSHIVGKAKYLEDPFKRHASDMDTRIAEELRHVAAFQGRR